jgi:FAD binding domain
MLEIITHESGPAIVGAAEIAALRASLQGDVLLVDHADYETARRVWNGNVDRRPALIARCRSAQDVQCAVAFAGERGLLVSVRGGGHSAPGHGVNDGGMVIDLTAMKAIHVDPASARRAPREAFCGGSWTPRPRPTAWRPPAARFPTPASAA